MMIALERRQFLAAASSLAMAPTVAADFLQGDTSTVTVFSPRTRAAADLARRNTSGAIFALDGDIVRLWNKRLAGHRGAVKGYTNWSDFVLMRGLAEEKGLRLRAEQRIDAAGGTVFAWVMADASA